MLKDNSSREIQKIYKVANPNRNIIKVQIQGISRDKRKREWILAIRKEKALVGKIVRKKEKSMIVEY